MIIALDFDRTFTANPSFWIKFINDIRDGLGDVYIVTARQKKDTHPWLEKLADITEDIIFCDGQAKQDVCAHFGIKIDIWIDDNPLNILVSRPAGHEWEGYKEWRRQDLESQKDLSPLIW